MAAVLLFRDTNMAAVTSRENTLLSLIEKIGNLICIMGNGHILFKRQPKCIDVGFEPRNVLY